MPTNFWQGGQIAIWAQPNVTLYRDLTGYNSSSGTLSFDPIDSPYTDRNTLYSILNCIAVLDQPGEYLVDEASGTVYLWPLTPDPAGTADITYSQRKYGLDFKGNSHVTVRGFDIIKHSAGQLEWNLGLGIRCLYTATGLEIYSNLIAYNRSLQHYGAIHLTNVTNTIVRDNVVRDNVHNRGIFTTNSGTITVENNILDNNGNTGIVFYGVDNSTIRNNEVLNHKGTHANGITLYLSCINCIVEGNKVQGGLIALTTKDATNITIRRNTFSVAADWTGNTVADWGRSTGIEYLNNVLESPKAKALHVNGLSYSGLIIKNNVLDGATISSLPGMTHNIFTSLTWNQASRYGWSYGVGEFSATKTQLFVAADQGDFSPLASSPAIDAGQMYNGDSFSGATVDIGPIELAP